MLCYWWYLGTVKFTPLWCCVLFLLLWLYKADFGLFGEVNNFVHILKRVMLLLNNVWHSWTMHECFIMDPSRICHQVGIQVGCSIDLWALKRKKNPKKTTVCPLVTLLVLLKWLYLSDHSFHTAASTKYDRLSTKPVVLNIFYSNYLYIY